VIEARATSKGHRGLVRSRNRVINQHDQDVLVYTPLRMLRRRPSEHT
jgi:acyl dehydratase